MERKRVVVLIIGIFIVFLAALLWFQGHSRPLVAATGEPAQMLLQEAIPSRPPDVSKISVGAPDQNGIALVSGTAGAVEENAGVAIINISSRNVMTATADSSGAFSASLFAPPGSSLLIKYDPSGERITALWHDSWQIPGDFNYMNVLPGATIFVEGSNPGPGVPFHSAGYFGPGEGPDWAGWWVSGTVNSTGGLTGLQPGELIVIDGEFQATSPALNCSEPFPYSPHIFFDMRTLFAADGHAYPWPISFNSYLFTPTGLPIEHEAGGETQGVAFADILNLTCVGPNAVQGEFYTDFTVPVGLDDGVYKLEAYMQDDGIPLTDTVPRVVVWHHFDPVASLPLLTVGTPQTPRIPWTLLGDYYLNGHRGLQAQEDAGRYQMLTRTIFPPHRVAVPMLDPHSGDPLVYRLEPGSNWLSATDRRFPNPPFIPLDLPGGFLEIEVHKPDGSQELLGPAPINQSSVRMPSLADGGLPQIGTGHIGDLYHLYTGDESFAFSFDQYGPHTIIVRGEVEDVYGNVYPLDLTYELNVARILDLDPAQLPTMPYKEGDAFAPGLHLFPPVPADVEVRLIHMPNSDPNQAQETVITGQANRFGYFQPPPGTEIRFDSPGEFRVDISAEYEAADGTLWAGYVTWGNVVENASPLIVAHGRHGMDYNEGPIDDMDAWFWNANLPPEKMGIENYYPYWSGDIHWGDEFPDPEVKGDSIHTAVTLEDLTTPTDLIYDLMRDYYPRATNVFRNPPVDFSINGLNQRLAIGEGPLFLTTASGRDAAFAPEEIDMWGYWYGSSQRPDVHVREIISEDGIGTAYWRFDDTYGLQIGEPANGDQPGDIKWEFGGIVFRAPGEGINQYAIYSSLWVLLPHDCESDPYGCARVTPPFQSENGSGFNGGPIMTLLGQEINMLFLPKGVRPGDVLEVGDTVSFSGHVGPPLNSQVDVKITSPTGIIYQDSWQANKIGWVYDPGFDFVANEAGRWTVDLALEHQEPYFPTGYTPTDYNTGTVLGTGGRYEFYVVEPESPRLFILSPQSGVISWPSGTVEPIIVQGQAPAGTAEVRYTIHDKGIVMGQGSLTPDVNGMFSLSYDPVALNGQFSMLSLTAHDALRDGLSDEVSISFLAIGGPPAANQVMLIGEEIFVGNALFQNDLPVIFKP